MTRDRDWRPSTYAPAIVLHQFRFGLLAASLVGLVVATAPTAFRPTGQGAAPARSSAGLATSGRRPAGQGTVALPGSGGNGGTSNGSGALGLAPSGTAAGQRSVLADPLTRTGSTPADAAYPRHTPDPSSSPGRTPGPSAAPSPTPLPTVSGASPTPSPTPTVSPTPTASSSPTPAQAVPGHIALGFAVWDPTYPTSGNQFQNYQAAVGSTPNFVEFYQDPWQCGGQTGEPLFWGNEEQLLTSDHLTPVISWGTNSIPLTYILGGGCNAYIDQSAAAAKTWPGSVYIRLDWEMNGSWSAWNPAKQGVSDATFVQFWQYVVNRFAADGVTNVKWVWAPNIDQNGSRPFGAYYPGNSYVNMVGLDGYNYAWAQGDAWQTFAQLFQASYNEMLSVAPGKQIMISEVSSVEANSAEAATGVSKAGWIQQMAAYIPASMPQVTALCWFDQPTGGINYSVNSSATALAAWDKYIVGASDYQGRLP